MGKTTTKKQSVQLVQDVGATPVVEDTNTEFNPATYMGDLAQLTDKERRDVRRYRKQIGFKMGTPVIDLPTGKRLVFLRPGKNRMIRCATTDGFNAAEKAFKDAVVADAINAKASVAYYVKGSESLAVPEKNLVTVAVYEERANTPENAKLLKDVKALEAQRSTLQNQLNELDGKLTQAHSKISASLQGQ